jgi:hypothetical protein
MFKDNKFMEAVRVPLDEHHVEIVHNDLEWTDIEWDSKHIYIKSDMIGPLKCFRFVPIHEATS